LVAVGEQGAGSREQGEGSRERGEGSFIDNNVSLRALCTGV